MSGRGLRRWAVAWRSALVFGGGLAILAATLLASIHATLSCPYSTSGCSTNFWVYYGPGPWVSLLAYGVLLGVGGLPRRGFWISALFGEFATIGWVLEAKAQSFVSAGASCPGPGCDFVTGWNVALFETAANVAELAALFGAAGLCLLLVAHGRSRRAANSSLTQPQTA